MRLDRRIYVATTAVFFLSLNLIKLIPYAYFGQINLQNFYISAILLPLAPLGVYFGAYLTNKVSQDFFYSTFAKSCKFKWDFIKNINEIERWELLSSNFEKVYKNLINKLKIFKLKSIVYLKEFLYRLGFINNSLNISVLFKEPPNKNLLANPQHELKN